jgi:hypothetical protein
MLRASGWQAVYEDWHGLARVKAPLGRLKHRQISPSSQTVDAVTL